MNKILSKFYICLVIVMLFVWCVPFVFAAENMGTLQIYLKSMESKKVIQNTEVQIYRIADYDGEDITLTQEFSSAGISSYTLIDNSNKCAELLEDFVAKSNVKPYLTKVTDESGLAQFDPISYGIYFVRKASDGDSDFEMKSFIVSVPSMDENGNLTGEVICKPKCDETDSIDVSVTKVWKDNDDAQRPKSIEIMLYGEDKLIDNVVLSEDNNWTYLWKDMDKDCKYSIKEDVPDGYESSVFESDKNVFIVTNTKIEKPIVDNHLPQTGQVWWYIPVLISIGLFAFLLIRSSRYRQD